MFFFFRFMFEIDLFTFLSSVKKCDNRNHLFSYRLVTPQRLRFFQKADVKNGMFSSGIASPFKKRNVTPLPTIPRTSPNPPPPPPRVHSRPILISRLLRTRVLTR